MYKRGEGKEEGRKGSGDGGFIVSLRGYEAELGCGLMGKIALEASCHFSRP
jgi:hypothetical protein